MIRKFNSKIYKYSGTSLVETLITLVIISGVMMLVAMTLTALIKASAISSAKTLARNEREFIFDLLERYIENADPEEIRIYNVQGRSINQAGVFIDYNPVQLAQSFNSPITAVSGVGNEIHIRGFGSTKWLCLAYYPVTGDPDRTGYLVKATSTSDIHRTCLSTHNPDFRKSLVILNSGDIDVKTFDMSYYESASTNKTVLIDLGLEPIIWVAGSQSQFKPLYQDQLVVSTDKVLY